ncbi:hypothetical protein BYT27DRAFT_7190059 [Phlegmacium glaucopus]|nr:hypothetical protein BYT27DRAFT_7190059 [Phlegmacium glaucopus]
MEVYDGALPKLMVNLEERSIKLVQVSRWTLPNATMSTQKGTSRLNAYLQGKRQLTSLSWLESWTGPSHAKTWKIVCKINGEVRGEGTSTHKHIAKDLAADQAWNALNA